jgi:hypothetical protein
MAAQSPRSSSSLSHASPMAAPSPRPPVSSPSHGRSFSSTASAPESWGIQGGGARRGGRRGAGVVADGRPRRGHELPAPFLLNIDRLAPSSRSPPHTPPRVRALGCSTVQFAMGLLKNEISRGPLRHRVPNRAPPRRRSRGNPRHRVLNRCGWVRMPLSASWPSMPPSAGDVRMHWRQPAACTKSGVLCPSRSGPDCFFFWL